MVTFSVIFLGFIKPIFGLSFELWDRKSGHNAWPPFFYLFL